MSGSSFETGEGSVSADRDPSSGADFVRATFSHKGRREETSRRLAEPGVEMLQPRHHLVLQQLKRMVPGFRLVLVVEAEHQQRAEAADLGKDLLDLLGHRRGRADHPVAAGTSGECLR